ncbi:MAG: hypothetical protein NT135_00635 [Candidatus Berkelbacteria bacterium]|nr:hypothetical protein [Candidatus Berkelbacteria bacterium]
MRRFIWPIIILVVVIIGILLWFVFKKDFFKISADVAQQQTIQSEGVYKLSLTDDKSSVQPNEGVEFTIQIENKEADLSKILPGEIEKLDIKKRYQNKYTVVGYLFSGKVSGKYFLKYPNLVWDVASVNQSSSAIYKIKGKVPNYPVILGKQDIIKKLMGRGKQTTIKGLDNNQVVNTIFLYKNGDLVAKFEDIDQLQLSQ